MVVINPSDIGAGNDFIALVDPPEDPTPEEVRAWYAGEQTLPAKAVWIVFDDGRLDSFREATPILKRLGLKAAMFVAAHNADRSLPVGIVGSIIVFKHQASDAGTVTKYHIECPAAVWPIRIERLQRHIPIHRAA